MILTPESVSDWSIHRYQKTKIQKIPLQNSVLLPFLFHLNIISWNEQDVSLHTHARDCLTSVLITLSDELPVENEKEVLQYLHKAYDLVKQSDCDDANTVGYLLGCRYDTYGHHEQAIEYLTEYLHLCTRLEDNTGTGKVREESWVFFFVTINQKYINHNSLHKNLSKIVTHCLILGS